MQPPIPTPPSTNATVRPPAPRCGRYFHAAAMALSVALGVILAACTPPPRPNAAANAARTTVASPGPAPRATKIGVLAARVPEPWELPGIGGRLQRHRVEPGENLLIIARQGGLGFRALRDANPTIDEWEPKPDVELVVPSRWILPRAQYRGMVVNVPEMRLYMFPLAARPGERVSVLTWPIGIGAEEVPTPIGPFTVRSKDVNPTWVVPESILRKMTSPRKVVPPGPDNPLGDYRIRLSIDTYAIHGTNDPWTVGRLTTHGCIRLYPEDIADLFQLVAPGTPGEFIYQPVKLGEEAGRIYIEVHRDVYRKFHDLERHALTEIENAGLRARVDPERVRAAARARTGIPVDVTLGADRAG